MKKTTFLFLLMLFATVKGFTQNPIIECTAQNTIMEDFDGVNSGGLPLCWTSILRGNNLSEFAAIGIIDYGAHSGTNCVLMTNGSSSFADPDIILVSPELSTLSLGTYRLKLWAKGSNMTDLEIGTLNSNNNDAVFTPLGEINTTETQTEYVIDFSSYTGTDQFIGIRFAGVQAYSQAYIDDIRWEISPLCPDISEILSTSTTDASTQLSWTPGGTETQWEVVYGTNSVTNPENLSPTPADSPETTLNGLEPNTSYKVWVRSVCGTNNGAWIGPIHFTTACVPVNYFTENFDAVELPSLPGCWSKILRGPSLFSSSSITVTDENTVQSENSVALYNSFSNTAGDDDIILVSPNLGNLGAGTHRLKFYAKGAGSLQIGTLNGNTDSAAFSVLQTVTTTNSSTLFTIDFSSYDGEDTFIGIRHNADDYFVSIYIDDVTWETLPLCPDVTNIIIPSTTTTTADIAWTAGAEETQWQIVYGNVSVNNPNILTPSALINTETTQITDLTENTSYKVWVRSVCGADNGAWIGPVIFTTACLPINAFIENFDTTTAPQIPECWTTILRGPTLSQYATLETTDNNIASAPNAVQFYNDESDTDDLDDIILVSPNLGNLSAGTHRLKLTLKGNSSMQIGTLSNNNNSAVFTVYETLASTNTTTTFAVNFDNYSGTDTYIGIRQNATSTVSVYADNIIWEPIPACPDVMEIASNTITTSSISVNWSPGGAETNWEIGYTLASITNPESITNASPVNNAPEASINGLEENTAYNIWVRSKCGVNAGAWIGPLTVNTACTAVNEFNEGFETAELPALPSCWSSILRGSQLSENAVIKTVDYNANGGINSVRLSNSDSGSDHEIILVSPNLGNLSAGTHRLKFHAFGYDNMSLNIGTLNSPGNSAEFTFLDAVYITTQDDEFTIDFTGYTGSDSYVGIRLNANDMYASAFIDDIRWELAPLCPDLDIDAITASQISTTTATINWEPGGSETNWQIVYAESSVTDPSLLTPGNILTDPSTQINGLNPATSYHVWVRSVCGGTDGNGSWIGPVQFNTQCLATTTPYTQDFETASVPALPQCTSMVNAGEGNDWDTENLDNYGFEGTVLSYKYNNDNPANAWFFTQGITLQAGTSYTITYKYGNNSSFFTEKLKIMYGTSASAEAMEFDLADHPEITGANAATNAVTFTPTADGTYYFGFNAYSETNQYYLFVDDIAINASLSTVDNQIAGFSYYPNPVKNSLRLSANSDFSSAVVYNMLGQKVMENKLSTNKAQLDLSGLAAGTYMVKVISGQTVQTIKIVKR